MLSVKSYGMSFGDLPEHTQLSMATDTQGNGPVAHDDVDNVSLPVEAPDRRGKRKANTSANADEKFVKKRRRKLQLNKLLDMPLDILFEILGHLHPLGLLHLARTTKAFRGILMNRSAAAIWRQAREQLEGLSDCPPDMSEPQYANLMFDPHCHFCLSARVMTVMWVNRVRCCKSCLSKHFVSVLERTRMTYFGYVFTDFVPCDSLRNNLYASRAKFEIFLEQYVQHKCETDHDRLKDYVKKNAEELKPIIESAAAMEDWHEQQSLLRAMDKDEIRQRRQDAILIELRKLGYGEEIDRMRRRYLFADHALVKQPKELTPRIWKNIKDAMIQFMAEMKRQRLEDERFDVLTGHARVLSDIIREWSLHQPRTEFLPVAVDYCTMPEIQAIVDKWDVDPAAIDKAEVINVLSDLAKRWRRDISRRFLLSLIPGHQASAEADHVDLSSLSLATTWFMCRTSGETVGYPRILVHQCYLERLLRDGNERRELNLQSAMRWLLHEHPWRLPVRGLQFNEPMSLKARKIVEACGKDPATTTASELDELDARYVCGEPGCLEGTMIEAMSWRTTILRHRCAWFDMELGPSKWIMLDEPDAALVRSREIAHDREHSGLVLWSCLRCYDRCIRTYRSMKEHLQQVHEITGPQKGVDFDVDQDTDNPYPGPPVSIGVPLDDLKGLKKVLQLE